MLERTTADRMKKLSECNEIRRSTIHNLCICAPWQETMTIYDRANLARPGRVFFQRARMRVLADYI
jgi:hypothetical protein